MLFPQTLLTNVKLHFTSMSMIGGFHHKGLKLFYVKDDRSKVPQDMADRIGIILADLDCAKDLEDLSHPSFRLHPLKGEFKGFHAVTVRANWRIIFRFCDGNIFDVDLVDYH